MQEAKAKYREMILKVVQKILIKTRHEACRRLKFSSACSCEQSEAKISLKSTSETNHRKFKGEVFFL
jgi:hypothetical protein